MVSVFNYLDYIEAINELIKQAKQRPGKWTMAQMAEATQIQASYLTNVLKGRVEFNSDQLYLVGKYLGLNKEQIHYLQLLLEYKRSFVVERKAELKKEIEKIQKEYRKTEAHIKAENITTNDQDLAEYYLDPFCQIVFVFLNFEEYARDPAKICTKLAISEQHLAELLVKLEKIHYIEKVNKTYVTKVKNRHLSKESPLCQPHQLLLRYKSIDQMQRLLEKDKYSFSVTFSSSTEDKDKIHSEFLEFLKKAEAIVKSTSRENVYQLNFDLFPWDLK